GGCETRVVEREAGRGEMAAERELRATFVAKETLLADADFVTIHVNLTAETRHLIDEAALKQMKKTAVLVNAARGPIVDEGALVRALREGWIAAAGLDVFEDEPKINPGLLPLR